MDREPREIHVAENWIKASLDSHIIVCIRKWCSSLLFDLNLLSSTFMKMGA